MPVDIHVLLNIPLDIKKYIYIISQNIHIKEKVEFWEEVNNILWASSLLLCKYGRTSDKKCF